jgi:hypothetical protein
MTVERGAAGRVPLPGTDLFAHAGLLHGVYETVLGDDPGRLAPRTLVSES